MIVHMSESHPSLDSLYIIDALRNERISPNIPSKTYRLDNDLFEGDMLAMIRTPDCDAECAPAVEGKDTPLVDYFREKQRRFEFQFQFKLKRVPEGQVYFAGEVEKPCKLGVISRAFAGAALAFVKAKTKNFRYSVSGSPYKEDGKYEVPHLAFPYEQGMSRIVMSRPGEPIPKLGQAIPETDEEYTQRKKGKRKIVAEMGTTYTMAIWSAYCDYLEWKCVNLPGLRPLSMSNILGDQALHVTLYEVGKNANKHYRKDVNVLVSLEMCNSQHIPIGPAAKAWKALHAKLITSTKSEEDVPNVEVDEHGHVSITQSPNGVLKDGGKSMETQPAAPVPEPVAA